MLQLAVVVIFQRAALGLLAAQPGYVRFRGNKDISDVVSPENTVTYVVALAQFIILALVFNKGMPHRSPLWTNTWLVMALVGQAAFVLYSLFTPDRFNTQIQQLVDTKQFGGILSQGFRGKLLGLILANGATAVAAEYAAQGCIKLNAWLAARKARRAGGLA